MHGGGLILLHLGPKHIERSNYLKVCLRLIRILVSGVERDSWLVDSLGNFFRLQLDIFGRMQGIL